MSPRELRRWRIGMTTATVLLALLTGVLFFFITKRIGPWWPVGLVAASSVLSFVYADCREMWQARPTKADKP